MDDASAAEPAAAKEARPSAPTDRLYRRPGAQYRAFPGSGDADHHRAGPRPSPRPNRLYVPCEQRQIVVVLQRDPTVSDPVERPICTRSALWRTCCATSPPRTPSTI